MDKIYSINQSTSLTLVFVISLIFAISGLYHSKKNWKHQNHGYLKIKIKKRKILLLPGDGVGPEVIAEVKKIIQWFNSKKSLDFETDEDLAGGASYDKHGTPITDEVFYKALESKAVMLGAVGGPKWDNLEFSKKPERALLKLRKELKLFANLRPAICFKQLVDASTLKPEIVSDLDIMIVRELTGGIYFGEPRGITPRDKGER